MYFVNALVYEPVARSNTTFEPPTDGSTLAITPALRADGDQCEFPFASDTNT